MFRRLFLMLLTFSTLASLPASAAPLAPLGDPALELAATFMKSRNYSGARTAALKAPPSGARDFLVGLAAFKCGEWAEAADTLARATATFPLLADYALSYQAQALFRLGRYSEVVGPLEKLAKNHSDSPLNRSALLLDAEALQGKGDFPAAIATYQKFIEKYPAGADALTALYKSALCRDLTGDTSVAVASLRQIWLNSPASPLAAKAEAELKTIAARGFTIAPYTAEELYRRAVVLYDLKKYPQAVAAFKAVSGDAQNDDFKARLTLKTGQGLVKTRHYKEAEQTLLQLLPAPSRKGIAEEARYWLAKAQDRNGKEDAAVDTLLQLAENAPNSDMADDALLDAGLIRKSQKKSTEALAILKKLMQNYPATSLKQSATWSIAWLNYQTGDKTAAAEYFKKLTETDATREKALYWFGHALSDSGKSELAKTAYAELLADYPFGFYAYAYRNEERLPAEQLPVVSATPLELLPVPEGYERVKTLIAFGLFEEAKRELSRFRKKSPDQKSLTALARLYLEMEDYNAALNLFTQERPRRLSKDPAYAWGLSYPLAYREAVSKNAAATGVAENLVYAIIRAESSFSPVALSPVGAVGLMQLMPATAASVLGAENGKDSSDRLTRPAVNISAGVKHLHDLLTFYKGNQIASIAAYNAGSAAVNRWLKQFGTLPPDEFIETIPYAETREYVKRVLAVADLYNRLYRLGTPPELKQNSRPQGESTAPRLQEHETTVAPLAMK